MGINIGNGILYMSNKLDVTIEMDRFSDTQLKNIVKYVKTGNVPYGPSATAAVAEHIVNKFKVPHFRSNTWYLRWENVDDQEFRDTVIAQATLQKLADSDYSRSLDHVINSMNKKETSGEISLWYFSKDVRKVIKKSKVKNEISDEVNDFLNRMLNHEIKTIDITLWKHPYENKTATN
jgi:hypothetical protein